MATKPQVQANDQAMDDMAEEGRVTDTVMGHLTNGEIVIPLNISTNERAFDQLALMFELSGMDIREYIVGHKQNKINPETGHPEFWGISIGGVSIGSSGVKIGGTTIIGQKGMNAITQPIKTVTNVAKDAASTVTNVTKDIISIPVNTTKDVINTGINVTKDLAKGDVSGAVSDVGQGISNVGSDVVGGLKNAASDTVAGVKQGLKDAYTGVMKETANIMDVLGILPEVPPVNSPSDSSPSTVTQGDAGANQRQQAVTDVQAAAGGGASSLTPRTVSGPDNDYKLNKSAVLGL